MSNVKLIKELRNKTGAGFLDVKKALEASNNDFDKAIQWLEKQAGLKVSKKAQSIAVEGVVITKHDENHVIIFELNCETDFVAKNDQFIKLTNQIAEVLLNQKFESVEDANELLLAGVSLEELCKKATATIGEKIQLRRALKIKGEVIGAYTHANKRIAAIVLTSGGTNEIAKNVAMHVASMNPPFLDKTQIPPKQVELIKKEIAQSPALKDKPSKIQDHIAKGMLHKRLGELTLVGQQFVMEKMTVQKYLEENKAKALKMVRFELGEGIDKPKTDFAAEVALQMQK